MNLITKNYKMYKLQIKIQKVLLGIIMLSFLYLSYLGFTFMNNTNALKAYSNTESQIKKIEQDISNIDLEMTNLDAKITELDEFLMQEPPTENELKSFHVNNIMYNVLDSTNNGTKLHNIVVIGNQMEISGVSKNITDISSIADNLSKYYEVDISKTQQINHNNEGMYYAFKIILTERG